MAEIFFTADTHFCHTSILRMADRPFETIEEHDAYLLDMWNATVGPRDLVYHLGDFAHKAEPEKAARIFDRLNGVKHLITGNHDLQATRALAWASQQDRLPLKIDADKIMLDHYPSRAWLGSAAGSYQLYGHVHGRIPTWPNSTDAGVDVWDYKPASWPQLRARMAMAPAHVLEELDGFEAGDDELEIVNAVKL